MRTNTATVWAIFPIYILYTAEWGFFPERKTDLISNSMWLMKMEQPVNLKHRILPLYVFLNIEHLLQFLKIKEKNWVFVFTMICLFDFPSFHLSCFEKLRVYTHIARLVSENINMDG
jgi:hypothetical protein